MSEYDEEQYQEIHRIDSLTAAILGELAMLDLDNSEALQEALLERNLESDPKGAFALLVRRIVIDTFSHKFDDTSFYQHAIFAAALLVEAARRSLIMADPDLAIRAASRPQGSAVIQRKDSEDESGGEDSED